MVTHDMNDAIKYGNRLIMLHQGQIVVDVKGKAKEKLEIAKSMLKDGMDLEMVMKYTGLSKDKVLNLKENI